ELVEQRSELVQEIIDMLFSFGELGMQEFETQRYLTGLLEEEGFEIELGVAGMPSAWTARWSNGTGEPVIALGSDVDGIPQSNQK
ncbi:MAG: amidohydrolase, partial [Gemmatimonadetes bacterium]|nr:amidohydrolase [Gemmatimonadota bacterium]